MESRKKTKEQLRKDLEQKIKGTKALLALALNCDFESDERTEYSYNIATNLRAILFGDKNNGFMSLIHRAGYNEKLLFPLYNHTTCLSILPTYNLLQFLIRNNSIKVGPSSDLFKTGGFWGLYLTFESWLSEIVIDTKLEDVEPLSRLLIVKIVSDSNGAHVDDKIEKHLFNMSKHDLLPVVIQNGEEIKKDFEVKAKAILCETVLAIAQELITAYESFLKTNFHVAGSSKLEARVQKYHPINSRFELVKYSYIFFDSEITINTYNANRFFECEIYSKRISSFEMSFNHRLFSFSIIDYKAILQDGTYLGKSIYPDN